jgi:hypothetical protein
MSQSPQTLISSFFACSLGMYSMTSQQTLILSFFVCSLGFPALSSASALPTSLSMCDPDADLWFKAASDQIDVHHSNGTWESVPLPAGHCAIGCHWVFKVERNADGSVECYKAHLVTEGYSQRPGVDFDETFAPTAKWAAPWAILAICALEDWKADSVNISKAFLN